MKLRQLFDDDRAVSPVIGVILMVAITVILAAVIGTFVLGLGDQIQTTSPTASFETDYSQSSSNNDTLELTHGGGDTIAGSQLSISASTGVRYDPARSGNSGGSVADGTSITFETMGASDVSAGVTKTVEAGDLSAETVRVVWSGEDGDSSSILGKWSGPDA